MMTTTSGVVIKYKDVWQVLPAYADGVDALAEKSSAIDEQVQIIQGNSGAGSAKRLARAALGLSACEIIGAVGSYTAKYPDPELAAKVDYAPSTVIAGKASEVVARCKTIWTAANEVVTDLGDYGITAAKLAGFKKRIDAFDGVKVAPRQSRVEKKAAVALLSQLVREGVAVLRDQLDGLMIQFKEANPNFYEEYFAARVVVDNRSGKANNGNGKVTPAPVTPTAEPATATA